MADPTNHDVMLKLHKLEIQLTRMQAQFEIVKKSVFGAVGLAMSGLATALLSIIFG